MLVLVVQRRFVRLLELGKVPTTSLLPVETIWPVFFWQAGQEVEEQHRHLTKPLCVSPKQAPELARIRIDTIVGMAFSSLASRAIVFATAATLHAHGITNIATSAQAAEALRPIAGVRLCAVRRRDHRHRAAGSPGAGRIGGLCG